MGGIGSKAMNRVYLTGYGFLSCLGDNRHDALKLLKEGQIAAKNISRFDTSNIKTKKAFEIVEGVDYFKYIPPSLFRKMDNPQKYITYSTKKAIENAKMNDEEAKNASIFVGTSFGGTDWTERFFVDILLKGPKFANPQYFPPSVPNAAAGQLSILLNNTCKNQTFCHKEISSELALRTAFREMVLHRSDSCFVGGFEELGIFIMLAFEKMGILTEDPDNYLPFLCSKGFIMGEGSATIVLESEANIKRRNITPIAELLSMNVQSAPARYYDYSADHEFYAAVMENALNKAGIGYDDIDLIFSCANSSGLDAYESKAIEKLDEKYGIKVPVFAPKGYIGEFYGSGIMRLVMALMSMENSILFPHSWIDDESHSQIDIYRPQFIEKDLRYILLNSFSNGGLGVSYIIKKYE